MRAPATERADESVAYIVAFLLLVGALLIWWLPPVRMHTRGSEPVRKPTPRPSATLAGAAATPTASVPVPQAGVTPAALRPEPARARSVSLTGV